MKRKQLSNLLNFSSTIVRLLNTKHKNNLTNLQVFLCSWTFSLTPGFPLSLVKLKKEALGCFSPIFEPVGYCSLDWYYLLMTIMYVSQSSSWPISAHPFPTLYLSYISLINTPYIFILWSIPSDPLLWHHRLYTSSELSLEGWSNRAEAQSLSILHYSLSFCQEYHSFIVKHMSVRQNHKMSWLWCWE